MQWVCYTEVQGLYAGAARQAGLAPADRPVVIIREGRVFDGCRDAFVSGLTLGAPARQAMRDAPRAVLIEWEQLDATPVATAWWDRALQYTPYVEPDMEHQLFLALPSPGQAVTPALKAEVAALHGLAGEAGFAAFTGVAPSRLLARAAALACRERWLLRRPGQQGYAEPAAQLAFVLSGEEARFLAPLPVSYLPAAPEAQRRLARLGIRTIGEVARIGESEWVRQLGPLGRQLSQWSRGIDSEPVKPAYPPRTLEKRVEFAGEVRDRDHLEQVITRHAAALVRQLAGKGEGCQQVGLLVERADGAPVQLSRTLAKLQQTAYPVQQALRTLLEQVLVAAAPAGEGPGAAAGWDAGIPVTAVMVSVGLIGPMPWQQLDLWDDSGRSEREERLQRALTLLHERFPARIVGLGLRDQVSFREQMLQFSDPYRWATS